jgi:aryl-alcohol dehydrogenase-like predicted oxidoreductase
MFAWQFAKAQSTAEQNGWTKFVTMQNLCNLIYREEEREMIPLCIDQKVGLIPWSPLAKGRLTREPGTQTNRSNYDVFGARFFSLENQSDLEIIRRVGNIAEKRGVSRAQIALAWIFGKPFITSPIVGFTKLSHLESAVEALSIVLSNDEVTYLEEAYTPHDVVGFS